MFSFVPENYQFLSPYKMFCLKSRLNFQTPPVPPSVIMTATETKENNLSST